MSSPGKVDPQWLAKCREHEDLDLTVEKWIAASTNVVSIRFDGDGMVWAEGLAASRYLTQTEIDSVQKMMDFGKATPAKHKKTRAKRKK